MRYAEEANYWQTTVHPAISQGEVTKLLEEFGADAVFNLTGQVRGKYAWMIRFRWNDRQYRFTFTPLACKNPSREYRFDGKKRTAEDQARYQMGRIAAAFVKAILTAAEAQPDALFGFLELPFSNEQGIPATTADLDVDGLTKEVPGLTLRLLGAPEE